MATANTLAAILNGAKQIETTFWELVRELTIEEIITILTKTNKSTEFTLPDVYKTSINISKILDFQISENKPIIGENIFKHESGIHQDGTKKYKYVSIFVLVI